MELNTAVNQENTYHAKEEDEENTPNKETEIFIMNYDEEDYEYEEFAQVIKQEPQEASTCKEIPHNVRDNALADTKLIIEEPRLCDEVTTNEILEIRVKNTDFSSKGGGKDNTLFNGKTDVSLDVEPYKRKRKYQDDPKRKLTCAECGFKALKKHHLASHIQLAHPKNPQPKQSTFECSYCMFSTKFKKSLSMHMSNFHLDEIAPGGVKAKKKKSSFDVTGTKVEDHSTLREDGVYSCNYCSYVAPKKIHIRHHIVLHVVEKMPVKQCPYCDMKYTQTALRRHIQKVHNPEGLFKCPKCYYVTKFQGNLRRHVRLNKNLEKCAPLQARRTSVFKVISEKNQKKCDVKKNL